MDFVSVGVVRRAAVAAAAAAAAVPTVVVEEEWRNDLRMRVRDACRSVGVAASTTEVEMCERREKSWRLKAIPMSCHDGNEIGEVNNAQF